MTNQPKEMKIEDVILGYDRKGMSGLRPFLPEDFCEQAARLITRPLGNAFIVTGFFILKVGLPETDGPPGAVLLGRGLKEMGFNVFYITDQFSLDLMQDLTEGEDAVISFPLDDDPGSEKFAQSLLKQYQPSLLVSIERCGRSADGRYLNMSGVDISSVNAKIDYLFLHHGRSIGIGDLGNEIGMGNLAHIIPSVDHLVPNPCVTRTTQLIIASVSNWGGYGLLAALSKRLGRNLVPRPEEERRLIERAVAIGAVDGCANERVCTVDGFPLEENAEVLSRLHKILAAQGIG